ncbi:MAG: hypothetical protein KatS3mg115_0679 [Candidatus Poribacteria bacterium]|nr:MAG: hypothetical protein KatS3mg115_0679 [Candidatus Poribacteria bacterium]
MMRWPIAGALLAALVASAYGTDIAFYVGSWNTDGWYGPEQFDHVDKIVRETGSLFESVDQFGDPELEAFGQWAEARVNDGKPDVIWLNGCMPSVLYPFPNKEPDGSLIERWIEGGNIVINVGDWFGYVSYECNSEVGPNNPNGKVGSRCQENGSQGAANILDLAAGIITFADNTQMKPTPTGKKYLPSIERYITFRPVVTAEVKDPWEVAAVFASTSGNEDDLWADPIVLHDTSTNGYVYIADQTAGGPGTWNDRAELTIGFLARWAPENIQDFGRPVSPQGKLATTWGQLKK